MLWVNLIGAAVAGLLVARVRSHVSESRVLLPLMVVGVAGALTTFSGLAVDTVMLIDAGRIGDALHYGGVSLLLGPVAAATGIWIGART